MRACQGCGHLAVSPVICPVAEQVLRQVLGCWDSFFSDSHRWTGHPLAGVFRVVEKGQEDIHVHVGKWQRELAHKIPCWNLHSVIVQRQHSVSWGMWPKEVATNMERAPPLFLCAHVFVSPRPSPLSLGYYPRDNHRWL